MTEFLFVCPECGQYEVNEEIFKGYLPLSVAVAFEERLRQGPAAVVIEFYGCCPTCFPSWPRKVNTVKILWKKEDDKNATILRSNS